jgi:lysophospholipase L1-like esterase
VFRLLSKGLIALVATAMGLLLAEALARTLAAGPMVGVATDLQGYPTRTVDGVVLWDARNLRYERDDIRRAAEDRAAFTILGLGDSIMFGVNVDKEQTYLEQARRILAQHAPRPVRILNLAVPGYNTRQENALYEEREDELRPALVLVHYWGDDGRQYRVISGYIVDFGDVARDGRSTVRALPLPPALSDFLLLHSRAYDLLTHFMLADSPEVDAGNWTHVTRPLADIQARARRHGARLVVLASADLSGPSPQPTNDLAQLQRFASARGIEVIDLSTWLRGLPSAAIRLDGCHFNATGHRIIGEHLAEYLLQRDLKE